MPQASDDELEHYQDSKLKVYDRNGRDNDSENDSDEEEGVLGLEMEDDSEFEEERENIKDLEKKWAKKKTDFFKKGDESEDSDSDSDSVTSETRRAEEEKLVLDMEKNQTKHLTSEDFEVDLSSTEEENESDSDDNDDENVQDDSENAVKASEQQVKDLENEISDQLSTLKDQVTPLLNKLHEKDNQDVDFSEGISFLEAKSHLLLSYCLNLSFYLVLKSKGKAKDHPVLETLTKQKVMMEKIRSLDLQMRPQLERLLDQANDFTSSKTTSMQKKDAQVPLMNDLEASSDSESDSGNDDSDGEQNNRKGKLFKASKAVPVHYIEKTSRIEHDKRRIENRLKRNVLLKEINADLSEKPVQYDDDLEQVEYNDAQDDKVKRYQQEKEEFEENNMMRLRETKQDKKKNKIKPQASLAGVGQVMTGFDELNFLTKKKKKLEEDENKDQDIQKESLEKFLNDFKDEESKIEKKQKEEFKLEDPVKKIGNKKRKKDQERKQGPTTEFVDEDGVRSAGYKIMKNKGLQPHRKKTDRNPRKRMRTKYEKKLKQRKGQVKDMRNKAEGENYSGEKSGLRTGIVTSRQVGNI